MRKLNHIEIVNYLKNKFIDNLSVVIKEKDIPKLGEFLKKFYFDLIQELRYNIRFIEDDKHSIDDYENLLIELEKNYDYIDIFIRSYNKHLSYTRAFSSFFFPYNNFCTVLLKMFSKDY